MKFNRGTVISLTCILFPIVLEVIYGKCSVFLAVSTLVIAGGIILIGAKRKKGWGDLLVCGMIYTIICVFLLLSIIFLLQKVPCGHAILNWPIET